MMLLPCRIVDASFPDGKGDVVLNTDRIIWLCPHPADATLTLVRLTNEDVLVILAPFDDVRQEIEDAKRPTGPRAE